jgi:NPCBM/NEW2 domain
LSHSNITNVQQLDQLKPASYRHVSDNQLEYGLGIGRDVNGNPLQFGSRRQSGIAFRGVALHSSARAAYRWDGSPGKFLTEVQLAPTAGRLGSVICKVVLARGGNLQTVSEFSLRAGDGVTSHLVDIDIDGAQLVVLVVEKADQGQVGDHVLWLDARFSTPDAKP